MIEVLVLYGLGIVYVNFIVDDVLMYVEIFYSIMEFSCLVIFKN